MSEQDVKWFVYSYNTQGIIILQRIDWVAGGVRSEYIIIINLYYYYYYYLYLLGQLVLLAAASTCRVLWQGCVKVYIQNTFISSLSEAIKHVCRPQVEFEEILRKSVHNLKFYVCVTIETYYCWQFIITISSMVCDAALCEWPDATLLNIIKKNTRQSTSKGYYIVDNDNNNNNIKQLNF